MKTRSLFILIAPALALGGAILWLSPREPHYQGRSLNSWLRQCNDTPGNETQRLSEAQTAVRAMPVKKVLRRLLKLVAAKDDPVSLWMIDLRDKFRVQFLQWHSAKDFQQLGIAGFAVLGTKAAPAAGQLAKLLNEKDHAFSAERCLVFIGKPAEPVFCRALTNQDSSVRQWSVYGLAAVTDDVGLYIARIKPRLEDSSEAVRVTTVDAIGVQTAAPELAVPILAAVLQDSSDETRLHAINSLANFGAHALVAFPMLTNLVRGAGNAAGAALRTLIRIAPDRAWPIFTNYLAQGKPGINAALSALANVRPAQALPIVLARLQSPNITTRGEAFGLLRRYPVTSQIDAAMQTVATDSDPGLALAAKGFLTDEYATQHPEALLFPDEPGCHGKRLGEWLETRVEGGSDFTPAAKDAIRQMGTNAIPALLKRLAYTRPSYCFSPFQINLDAASGFIALGEQAKPALPELWAFMDSANKDIALTAMIAACGTGSNAMPFLIKGLTNQFPNVRGPAAAILTEGMGKQFPQLRQSAIPAFVKLLRDPDEEVRMKATNQLKEIDPQAAAQAGIK